MTNFKETRRPQVVVMNFQNGSILFKDVKLFTVNDLTLKQQIPECITAIT